jgi:hypothetical protein
MAVFTILSSKLLLINEDEMAYIQTSPVLPIH